ncbi:hypothetical protein [Nostoc sp. DedQUE09]|uniref:DinB/UmuC family translesion DNA polymerase n=1 Tax=Nostoc sp. DedQUE09 TaxID=3075394 RepID=UPI002AD1E101|nr:hypothetical protein [Nostoc sp. DedQUE09]MDZ7954970.1 hypothetical protein [Nostoc sp. DedQUE09]
MLQELEQIAQIVEQRLDQYETRGRTSTLKVKLSDYHQITCSKTMLAPISELSTIFERLIWKSAVLGCWAFPFPL